MLAVAEGWYNQRKNHNTLVIRVQETAGDLKSLKGNVVECVAAVQGRLKF